jgi:hypothetical protein
MLGGTLEMDLKSINMPLKGGTCAHLPNMPMAKIHIEEIDINTRTNQVRETIEESLPTFSLVIYLSLRKKILMLYNGQIRKNINNF